VTGAFDAVLEETDRLGRPVIVQQRLDVGLQHLGLGVGEPGAVGSLAAAPGRDQQRSAKRPCRVPAFVTPGDAADAEVSGRSEPT